MQLNHRTIILILATILVTPIMGFEPEKSDAACIGECDSSEPLHML